MAVGNNMIHILLAKYAFNSSRALSYSISLMSARLQDVHKHVNKIIKADLKTIRCFMDMYFSSASSVRGVGAFRFTAESGLMVPWPYDDQIRCTGVANDDFGMLLD